MEKATHTGQDNQVTASGDPLHCVAQKFRYQLEANVVRLPRMRCSMIVLEKQLQSFE